MLELIKQGHHQATEKVSLGLFCLLIQPAFFDRIAFPLVILCIDTFLVLLLLCLLFVIAFFV